MITNQKKYNYNALFDKANKALGYTGDNVITSINDYFASIEELAQIDLKFTILPLDEETFDIDANTRKITIPNSFKNGVGVQGDQAAEIIYFKIDRYFDATDLNTQSIYIEWENAEGEKGLSKEYVRDIESDPDHIIFGWPLVSQITEKAGTIKFAVRFYTLQKNPNTGNNEVVYSFATQPANIMINNTLNFNLTDNSVQKLEDDVISMIVNRFTNSAIDDNSGEIEAPKFIVDLISNADQNISANDGYDEDTTTYALKVSATQPSAKITYQLRRSEPGMNSWEAGALTEIVYLESNDIEYNAEKTYYKEVIRDGVLAYEVIEEDQFDDVIIRYEAFGIGKVSKPGDYMMQAKAKRGKSTAISNSKIVSFPYPIKPALVVGEGKIFDENGECELRAEIEAPIPTGTLVYEWHDGSSTIENSNSNVIKVKSDKEEVIYSVKVKNTRNNAETEPVTTSYRVTKPAQTPKIIYPTEEVKQGINTEIEVILDTVNVPYDEILVEWFKAEGYDMTNLEDDEKVGSGLSYTPTASGLYYAKVKLTRGISSAEAISEAFVIM